MVEDDDTLLGVRFWSEDDVDGFELNKALLAAKCSSDDDGSTMTDLLDAGVLVTIVDVVVIFDDVTEDGVDWSIYRKIILKVKFHRKEKKIPRIKISIIFGGKIWKTRETTMETTERIFAPEGQLETLNPRAWNYFLNAGGILI